MAARSYDVPSSTGAAYSIKIVPAHGTDNYMYLIVSEPERKAVAIDPLDASTILTLCQEEGLELVAVLTTHWHSDHSGGNAVIAKALPDIPIMVGEKDADRTPAVTRSLVDGEDVSVAGLSFRCIDTPCHTRGHVVFYLDAADGQAPALFSGDALFVAGCGRFLEGPPEEMQSSLSVLKTLPAETRVFCGHEYTVTNFKFAASLEPSNELIAARLQRAEEQRAAKLPTVPSTMAEELEHNPFLRTTEPSIATGIGCPAGTDPVTVLAKIRRGKDTFTTIGKVMTFALDTKDFFQNMRGPKNSPREETHSK